LNILLDTQCWLWALSEPEKLNNTAQNLIADETNRLYLSVASVWEIGIKVKIGKLSLPEAFEDFIASRFRQFDITSLNITVYHAIVASNLPLHHKDPFDRMLIAQAKAEDLPILTTDNMFKLYDVSLIDV